MKTVINTYDNTTIISVVGITQEREELLKARYERLFDLLLSHEDNHTSISNDEWQAIDAEMVAIMDELSPKAKH